MEKGQSRDQTKKAIALLEVLLGSTQPISLDNINYILKNNGKDHIARSTFFKIKNKINDGNLSFQIVSKGKDKTERGYIVEVTNSIFGNNLSDIYKLINSDLYDGFDETRDIADDDNYYYPLKPSLEKIKKAIDDKKTLSFKTYNFDDGMWKEYTEITPFMIVIKPNKVWLYFMEGIEPKKVNLFLSHSFEYGQKHQSGMSLNEFKRRFMNDHGYFKDELRKLKITFKNQKQHILFHNILLEQNFLKYYKSWKEKNQELYCTEFDSLSKEQIKLFKTFEKLIKNIN